MVVHYDAAQDNAGGPDSAFAATAASSPEPGVEVRLAHDGLVVDVILDPAAYRHLRRADLGTAIVSAHRRALDALLERQRCRIRDALAEWGIDESAGTWLS